MATYTINRIISSKTVSTRYLLDETPQEKATRISKEAPDFEILLISNDFNLIESKLEECVSDLYDRLSKQARGSEPPESRIWNLSRDSAYRYPLAKGTEIKFTHEGVRFTYFLFSKYAPNVHMVFTG
jgi:hypothetical protein